MTKEEILELLGLKPLYATDTQIKNTIDALLLDSRAYRKVLDELGLPQKTEDWETLNHIESLQNASSDFQQTIENFGDQDRLEVWQVVSGELDLDTNQIKKLPELLEIIGLSRNKLNAVLSGDLRQGLKVFAPEIKLDIC